METTKFQKAPFKSVEDVKKDFDRKVSELSIDSGERASLLEFLLEENKQAWVRGKEYGWHKAVTWKKQKAAQAM
jgi:hypothetical protein